MTKPDLLSEDELPAGFRYPGAFHRVLAFNLTRLEPWLFLDGDGLRDRYFGLEARYPGNRLVPFAQRQDNDDVACWHRGNSVEVVIVHDFAAPGWELRATFPDFYAWFRAAVEDFIGWGQDKR